MNFDLDWFTRMNKEMLGWLDKSGQGFSQMFESRKSAQEIYEMTRVYWGVASDIISFFQEQNEGMLKTFVETGLITQKETLKMAENYLETMKKTREDFYKKVQNNLKEMEEVIKENKGKS